MIKVIIFALGLLTLLFIFGCENVDSSEVSDEGLDRISEGVVVCNNPYIRIGTECCLDQNNNDVCGNDEKNLEEALQPPQDGPTTIIPEPTQESTESEYAVSVYNEAEDEDVEIQILDQNGNSITVIKLASKKSFYNLSKGEGISNPSYIDSSIILTDEEQGLIIKEINGDISSIFHFDPNIGGNIIITYWPSGRKINGTIETTSGKLTIRQQEGYPGID